MFENDLDLGRLKTIAAFDGDTTSTMAIGIPQASFSPSNLLIESLIDQICKLMEKDPKNQRKLYLTVCGKLQKMNLIGSSYSIDEFQFMRAHYQKSLYKLLIVAKKTMFESKAITSAIPRCINICSDHLQEPSRYMTEFIEVDFIAKGGFGCVFKAQHKLDGIIYAVKKILLRYRSLNSFNNNLIEVKMLARLNNPNIVAYKAAWLEPVDNCSFNDHYDQQSDFSSSKTKKTDAENSSDDDDGISFVDPSQDQANHSSSASKQNNGKEVPMELVKYKQKFFDRKLGKNECAMLYIQMQFCSQTLRHWIDTRNQLDLPADINKSLDVFKQIVLGLQYIHSQDIVHHDIKPSNIFISEDEKQVQVGDFGLACGLIHGTHCGVLEGLENRAIQVAPHRPGMIGTELYAAPEQLAGYCHAKSDIYSLGIVLFELMVPFRTSMERSKVIEKLKRGEIPPHLNEDHPKIMTLLKEMVCKDCRKRPSATEVLATLDEVENHSVHKLIKEQEAIIKALREESLAKDQQIELLKEKLERLTAQHDT